MKDAVVDRFQGLCRERGIKYNELALSIGCYLDIALHEDGDFRTFSDDFQAMNETRSQISRLTAFSRKTTLRSQRVLPSS